MKATVESDVCIESATGDGPARITCPSDSKLLFILMPMKV